MIASMILIVLIVYIWAEFSGRVVPIFVMMFEKGHLSRNRIPETVCTYGQGELIGEKSTAKVCPPPEQMSLSKWRTR